MMLIGIGVERLYKVHLQEFGSFHLFIYLFIPYRNQVIIACVLTKFVRTLYGVLKTASCVESVWTNSCGKVR